MYNKAMKKHPRPTTPLIPQNDLLGSKRGGSAKGFTLMEVMVSVSIFTIIVTVGIGALLTINANYRKSQTDRKTIDSLTYILESMSRSIRTATSWTTTAGGSRFEYVDQDGHDVLYQYDSTVQGHISETVDHGTEEDITPDGVQIKSGDFNGSGLYFTPYENGTNGQRYVQINIGGEVQNGKLTSQFMFQTGISKRSFE